MRWALWVQCVLAALLRAPAASRAGAPTKGAAPAQVRRDDASANGTDASVNGTDFQLARALLAREPHPMSDFFSLFGHVSVAHLERATERLPHVERQLQLIGIKDYEIFSAVDGQNPRQVRPALLSAMHRLAPGRHCGPGPVPGYTAYQPGFIDKPFGAGEREAFLGCYLTHLKLLEASVARGDASLLLFEDDVEAVGRELVKARFVKHLPADWDFLWLGWAKRGPYFGAGGERYLSVNECDPAGGPVFCRLKSPILQNTHAIAISRKAMPRLIKMLRSGLETRQACAVDQMYRAFALKNPGFNAYAAVAPFFMQGSKSGTFDSHITAEDSVWPGR